VGLLDAHAEAALAERVEGDEAAGQTRELKGEDLVVDPGRVLTDEVLFLLRPLDVHGRKSPRGVLLGVTKLDTRLYTTAAEPCGSGDLSVPDPSPAQARAAISASERDWYTSPSGGVFQCHPDEALARGYVCPGKLSYGLFGSSLGETPAPEEKSV
jgi:hypothetical protein